MFLICHVTSRKHIFKGLCEFMGGGLLVQMEIQIIQYVT